VLDLLDRVMNKSIICVPVFSVKECTNPKAARDTSFGFATYSKRSNQTDIKDEQHGFFDLPTGIFTAKTAGFYHLNFYAHSNTHDQLFSSKLSFHRVHLKINDEVVDASLSNSSMEDCVVPIVISVVIPLKVGDRVGIFAYLGNLYQDSIGCATRFYGMLFLESTI